MLNAKSSSLGRPLRRERVSLVIARSVSGGERERERESINLFAAQCDELMQHNVNTAKLHIQYECMHYLEPLIFRNGVKMYAPLGIT